MNPRQLVISRVWLLTILGWITAFALLLLVTGDRREPVTVPTDNPTVSASTSVSGVTS